MTDRECAAIAANDDAERGAERSRRRRCARADHATERHARGMDLADGDGGSISRNSAADNVRFRARLADREGRPAAPLSPHTHRKSRDEERMDRILGDRFSAIDSRRARLDQSGSASETRRANSIERGASSGTRSAPKKKGPETEPFLVLR
ncbi:MAG: hypothetical protein E6Q50_08515 [Lysobacter sp.]|nr:MAG: hypothetical protein E6Q50_08515 [Lysobacter sp.]